MRIKEHVRNTVKDIEDAINGYEPQLAAQLSAMLGDDVQFSALSAAKAHLVLAKSVLRRGVSSDDYDTWFNTPDPYNNHLPGHGGVVGTSF